MHFLAKVSVASVALLAALGEAHNDHGHFHRRAYGNDTASGTAAPLENAAPSALSNMTLTYTLGTGSTKTVVTTTIFQTSTLTDVHTVTAAAPSDAAAEAGTTPAPEEGVAPTTTIESTSFTTTTITIYGSPGSGDSAAAPTGDGAAAGAGSSGCASPATVTVTEKEVVTVTITPSAAAAGANEDAALPTVSLSDEEAVPATTLTVVPTPEHPAQTAAPSLSAGPFNNGTDAQGAAISKSKKPCASTGFIVKPSSAMRH